MNTNVEMERLRQAVAARLQLTEDALLDAQLDLAAEYRSRLVNAMWLENQQEADLLGTLPGFWSWWRMRWANRDRVVLDKLPALAVVEMRQNGRDVVEIYKAYHGPAAWGDLWPNDVLMDELETAKRDQTRAYMTLKQLFNTL